MKLKNEYANSLGDYNFTISVEADGGASSSVSSSIIIGCELKPVAAWTSWDLPLPDKGGSGKHVLFSGLSNYATVNHDDCLMSYEIFMTDGSEVTSQLDISSDGMLSIETG